MIGKLNNNTIRIGCCILPFGHGLFSEDGVDIVHILANTAMASALDLGKCVERGKRIRISFVKNRKKAGTNLFKPVFSSSSIHCLEYCVLESKLQ